MWKCRFWLGGTAQVHINLILSLLPWYVAHHRSQLLNWCYRQFTIYCPIWKVSAEIRTKKVKRSTRFYIICSGTYHTTSSSSPKTSFQSSIPPLPLSCEGWVHASIEIHTSPQKPSTMLSYNALTSMKISPIIIIQHKWDKTRFVLFCNIWYKCIARTMILDAMLYALLRSRAGPQNKLNTKGICFLPYTSSHSRLGWIVCYILCHKCRKLKVEHAHSRWSILKAGVALSDTQWECRIMWKRRKM